MADEQSSARGGRRNARRDARNRRRRPKGRGGGGEKKKNPKDHFLKAYCGRNQIADAPVVDIQMFGPSHARKFTADASVVLFEAMADFEPGATVRRTGHGPNKREAEKNAFEALTNALEGTEDASAARASEDVDDWDDWGDDVPSAKPSGGSGRGAPSLPAFRTGPIPGAPRAGGASRGGYPAQSATRGGAAGSSQSGQGKEAPALGQCKSVVMNWCNRKGQRPPSSSYKRSGPSHAAEHNIELCLYVGGGETLSRTGSGRTKKVAEAQAFAALLQEMHGRGLVTDAERSAGLDAPGGDADRPLLRNLLSQPQNRYHWGSNPFLPEEALHLLAFLHRERDGELQFETYTIQKGMYGARLRVPSQPLVEGLEALPEGVGRYYEGSARNAKKKEACADAAVDVCEQLYRALPAQVDAARHLLHALRDGAAARELVVPRELLGDMMRSGDVALAATRGIFERRRRRERTSRDHAAGSATSAASAAFEGEGASFPPQPAAESANADSSLAPDSIASETTGSDCSGPAVYVPPARRGGVQRGESRRYHRSEELVDRQRRYEDGSDAKFRASLAARERLPAYKKREDIVDCISRNRVTVLVGDTGCGKSTQVPQLVLEAMSRQSTGAGCNIIVTQPRRVAAVSLAQRVASERCEPLGESVGYSVRLEKRHPSKDGGTILYCTVGVLLNRLRSGRDSGGAAAGGGTAAAGGGSGAGPDSKGASAGRGNDPLAGLGDVSHIIVDEAHERSLDSDFLLAILRECLASAPHLKLVVMSATINADVFCRYFASYGAVEIEVEGRTFPVESHSIDDLPGLLRSPHADALVRSAWREPQDGRGGGSRGRGGHRAQRFPSYREPELSPSFLPYDLVLEVLHYVHLSGRIPDDGAVLVFLPGWSEMDAMRKAILAFRGLESVDLVMLHSQMNVEEQQKAFGRPPRGLRKVVLSTNIAETSVTIEDVVCVVDCCLTRENVYDPQRNASGLVTSFAAKSSLKQRKGRAGRVRHGVSFSLLPERVIHSLPQQAVPEVRRVSLEALCLKTLSLGYSPVHAFAASLLDPPDAERLRSALQRLDSLQALRVDSGGFERLTSVGEWMSKVPLEPPLAKMVLLASFLGVLEPAATMASSLSLQSSSGVFVRPRQDAPAEEKARAKEERLNLSDGNRSDMLTTLRAIRVFEEKRDESFQSASQLARESFLSIRGLEQLAAVRRDLLRTVEGCVSGRTGREWRRNADRNSRSRHEDALLRAVLSGGLWPNVALLVSGSSDKLVTPEGEHAGFYHGSVNSSAKRLGPPAHPWFVYLEKVFAQNNNYPMLRNTTNVSTQALALLGATVVPHPALPSVLVPPHWADDRRGPDHSGPPCVFKGTPEVAAAICALQHALDTMLMAEAAGGGGGAVNAQDGYERAKAEICDIVTRWIALGEAPRRAA